MHLNWKCGYSQVENHCFRRIIWVAMEGCFFFFVPKNSLSNQTFLWFGPKVSFGCSQTSYLRAVQIKCLVFIGTSLLSKKQLMNCTCCSRSVRIYYQSPVGMNHMLAVHQEKKPVMLLMKATRKKDPLKKLQTFLGLGDKCTSSNFPIPL